jgi:hypothetical protein
MSRRAEAKLGQRLKVHAVIDADERQARTALAAKSLAPVADSYASTAILPDLGSYAGLVRDGKAPAPK